MASKKSINKLFGTWIHRLGLRWWTVDVYWYETPKQVRKFFGKRKDETVIAKTFADWRYATASVHINLVGMRSMSNEEAERVVLHELCHILVDEMREGEQHHEERVVTGLQKAFMWTRTLKDEDNGAAA